MLSFKTTGLQRLNHLFFGVYSFSHGVATEVLSRCCDVDVDPKFKMSLLILWVDLYSQLEQPCRDRLKECKIASKLFELMIVEISWSRVASWILKISGRISALSGKDAKLAYLYFWGAFNISKSSQDLKIVQQLYFASNFIGFCKKEI